MPGLVLVLQSASVMSSTRLKDTPARHISIKASSTEASRHRSEIHKDQPAPDQWKSRTRDPDHHGDVVSAGDISESKKSTDQPARLHKLLQHGLTPKRAFTI